MPLNEFILRDLFISNLKNLEESKEVNNVFANNINKHVLEQSYVKGIYIGFLPNSSTDPSNGTYNWDCSNCEINGSELLQDIRNISKNEDFITKFNNSFTRQLKDKIFYTDFSNDLQKKIKLLDKVKILETQVKIDMSSKPDNVLDSNLVIAKGIVNALLNSVITIKVNAISKNGGKGFVTFNKIL